MVDVQLHPLAGGRKSFASTLCEKKGNALVLMALRCCFLLLLAVMACNTSQSFLCVFGYFMTFLAGFLPLLGFAGRKKKVAVLSPLLSSKGFRAWGVYAAPLSQYFRSSLRAFGSLAGLCFGWLIGRCCMCCVFVHFPGENNPHMAFGFLIRLGGGLAVLQVCYLSLQFFDGSFLHSDLTH